MNGTSPPDGAATEVAGLQARYAALRQAARSPGADPTAMLDAAFTELEGAIELLTEAEPASGEDRQAPGTDSAERSLLRAAFADAPLPLFLIARDGTVQRANRSAGDLIGAKPGYATGRPFTAFVSLPSRAAVQSQLSAVSRTGKQRRIRCHLLAGDGPVPSELIIGRVGIRGEAGPLMVAVRDAAPARPEQPDRPASDGSRAAAVPAQGGGSGAAAVPARGGGSGATGVAARGGGSGATAVAGEGGPRLPGQEGPRPGAIAAITRRLDLVAAVARLLLENEGFSESRTLQRCARLMAGELAAWVIVDLERGHKLRRQFVVGPEGPRLAELTRTVAAVDPEPGSVPCIVHESGHSALIAHADDTRILGAGLDGEPLLIAMDATSVLSVALSDGETRYGALTLVRRARDGNFKMAELGLVEGLGEQMALAVRVGRTFRRRSDTADALHASLLPRRRPEIPGVDIAATYIAAVEDPEVGGDFYDVYRTPDGWGLAVGDVCGKGEEAAAVTAAARHAIRILARRCADPAEVLSGANEIVLAEELALDGGFVTANIAHLSWKDGRLRVVIGSAGHPAAMLLRPDGRVRTMNGGGLPLGLFPDAQPAAQELTMDPGDVLFLYSDGVAQARGADNTYFQDRLADELAGLAGYPPDRLVASMRQALREFSADDLVNDVTMLVVRAGRPPAAGAPASRPAASR